MQPLAGGYFALGIGGKSKNFADREVVHSFSKHMFKHFDGGLRFGCGVTYDLFYADLTYDLGLRQYLSRRVRHIAQSQSLAQFGC